MTAARRQLQEVGKEMKRAKVELPQSLAAWIAEKVFAPGGTGKLKIYSCRKLPFEWLPGVRPDIVAITLWNSIYLRAGWCPLDPHDPAKMRLLRHELAHIRQFRANPFLFPIRYLLDLARHGYRNH